MKIYTVLAVIGCKEERTNLANFTEKIPDSEMSWTVSSSLKPRETSLLLEIFSTEENKLPAKFLWETAFFKQQDV